MLVSNPAHSTRTGPNDPRNGNYSTDYRYRDNVANFFRLQGYNVTSRNSDLHGCPDFDFTYMSFARTFVAGGGGFSLLLIAKVVESMGGNVIIGENPNPSSSIISKAQSESVESMGGNVSIVASNYVPPVQANDKP